MEANEITVEGIGTIDKSEWVVVLSMDETVLLSRLGNQDSPKLWLTVEEWEGRPAPTEIPKPTVTFEHEPPVKFNNFQEATEAMAELKDKRKEKKKKEEKRTDMSTVPVEELDKLRTDELFTLALFTQGEKLVREKLYCALGHCQSGCKSCSKKDE